MYPTTSPLERLRQFLTGRSLLPKLILINIIIWLLIQVLAVFAFLTNTPPGRPVASLYEAITTWLAVPADTAELLSKPWTLVTYMFLHLDFLHILFNMLWLYWFGKIFLEYLNNRQLLFTYLSGGLAGGLLYILAFNFFPVFDPVIERSVALGASASVLAIVVAIAFYVPGYTLHLLFIGPVKIKYIAIISVIIDFLMIRSDNAGGHIAHLGGAFWGFMYIKLLRTGYDISSLSQLFKKMNFLTRLTKRKRFHYKKVHRQSRPLTDEEFNLQKVENQQKTDRILEKIKYSGYESLTRAEKEFLFSQTNR